MSKCKFFSCQHIARSTSSATSSITRPEMRLAADSKSILYFSKDPIECLRSLVSDSTESKGSIALIDSPSGQLVPNQVNMIFCKRCGAEVDQQSNYCSVCGGFLVEQQRY